MATRFGEYGIHRHPRPLWGGREVVSVEPHVEQRGGAHRVPKATADEHRPDFRTESSSSPRSRVEQESLRHVDDSRTVCRKHCRRTYGPNLIGEGKGPATPLRHSGEPFRRGSAKGCKT